MNWSLVLAAVLALGALASVSQAGCSPDQYNDFGLFYVDDEPTPYVYMESNAVDGLQRTHDGNLDGHCAHPNPDTWLF